MALRNRCVEGPRWTAQFAGYLSEQLATRPGNWPPPVTGDIATRSTSECAFVSSPPVGRAPRDPRPVGNIFTILQYSSAKRPRQASLPIRLPPVESLLRASFSFTSRLRLAFRYGHHHRSRLALFIQLDSAHAGHTGVGDFACQARRWAFFTPSSAWETSEIGKTIGDSACQLACQRSLHSNLLPCN